jgi:hypothetical protein
MMSGYIPINIIMLNAMVRPSDLLVMAQMTMMVLIMMSEGRVRV